MATDYLRPNENFDRANLTFKALRRIWLRPLIFFQLYLTVIALMFFWGPWPWPIDNGEDLLAYLAAAQVAIALGYFLSWGAVRRGHLATHQETINENVNKGLKFLKFSIIITLVLFVPTSLSRTGSFFPDVLNGINNTGYAYNDTMRLLEGKGEYVIIEYLRIFVSPFIVGLLPLSIVYWSNMSAIWRAFAVSTILSYLTIYVGTGTNKGIADLIILTPWFYYLLICTTAKKRKWSKWFFGAGVVLIFIAFLQFFNAGQMQRSGAVGQTGVMLIGSKLVRADSGALSEVISENQRSTYVSLTRYLTTGYYALAISFKVETPSTLGLGNSMFLARNADAIFDTDFYTSESIPGELERQFGFSHFGLWHSIYPWIASDVGFVGALFAMAFFAYLLGLSWGGSVQSLDHRWIVMAGMMFVLFFYISANNQIFQSGETCAGFFLTFAMIVRNKLHRFKQGQPSN
jgi:hypothetical protein